MLNLYKLFITLCMLICCNSPAFAFQMPDYALALAPTPVFNSPQAAAAAAYGNTIKPDRCGQIRELEMIALPGTVFKLLSQVETEKDVFEVSTVDYKQPGGVRLYISGHTVQQQSTPPESRTVTLPARADILDSLKSAVGLPYIWGGNYRSGIIAGGKSSFAGLDCSGLLYEASNGYTPRNTAELVHFGQPVAIKNLSATRLVQQLRPLDLIVWKGHLVIVLDKDTAIESILTCNKGNDGVVLSNLQERIKSLMQQRSPADIWPEDEGKGKQQFVVRRWLPYINH